jgi:hypothetical protein
MFEGFYFEYPKFAFLLFVFLACENLCPLRLPSFYVPHISRFWSVDVKTHVWMWVSKWFMISGVIAALMSPVVEKKQEERYSGYSILLAVESGNYYEQIEEFCRLRRYDEIALIMPPMLQIPRTKDHQALLSMVRQMPKPPKNEKVNKKIERFLMGTKRPWIVVFSKTPKNFVDSWPTDIEVSVVPLEQWRQWMRKQSDLHPIIPIFNERKIVDYLYVYPLFLAFLAMLVYLYGRNQKGLL